MEQTKETKQDPAAAKAAFTSIGSYPVRLTYLFTDPPTVIVFTCKMLMTADDIAARQAFYGLPQGDMEAGQFAYDVDMLSRIVTDVEGLPGFVPDKDKTAAENIKEYFADGGPILTKVAKDAIAQYNMKAEPSEFFR